MWNCTQHPTDPSILVHRQKDATVLEKDGKFYALLLSAEEGIKDFPSLEAAKEAALKKEGLRIRRKTRSGRTVALYRWTYESDPEFSWSTVCEDHGGVVNHATRKDAMSYLSHPEDWCPQCSGSEEPASEEVCP